MSQTYHSGCNTTAELYINSMYIVNCRLTSTPMCLYQETGKHFTSFILSVLQDQVTTVLAVLLTAAPQSPATSGLALLANCTKIHVLFPEINVNSVGSILVELQAYQLPRLRMCNAMPPQSLRAFMASTASNVSLTAAAITTLQTLKFKHK
jgi:hypothetical protein